MNQFTARQCFRIKSTRNKNQDDYLQGWVCAIEGPRLLWADERNVGSEQLCGPLQDILLRQSFRPLLGPIVITSVVKARVGPLLVGLDSVHFEAHRHKFVANLYAFKQVKELPYLFHVSTIWFL